MDYLRAVVFFPDDDSNEESAPPLMLEAVLFCPVLTWASKRLMADGVRRFFVACGPKYAEQARNCFPPEAEVTVSAQQTALLDFLSGPGQTVVLPCAAIPVEGAGQGYVYAAEGEVLRERWASGLSNAIQDAVTLPGFIPLRSFADLQEAEQTLRAAVVRRHLAAGVRMLDASAVYIDPRVEIAPGAMLLPGTLLQGESKIGRGCVIGPNALVRDCTVGDESEVNASQITGSTVGRRTHIGPFAYVRPGCTIGDDIKVGDFVEVKNSRLGDGTKISHLTYVGDSDVGRRVNFGCGTVTTNYDGFKKYRCTIEDDAFLGCNTNLIAPVRVGEGAYTAAGSTITEDVPAQALAVARARQKNLEGWAERNRRAKAAKK